MSHPSLQDFLAERILSVLEANAAGTDGVPESLDVPDSTPVPPGPAAEVLRAQAMGIAETLVHEAVRSGLPLTRLRIDNQSLGGGNTAELVERIALHAPFVFKLDSKEKKLAGEARAMQKIKQDRRLPERYRQAWPTIYAVRDQSPYAYLMEIFPSEDGWASWEDLLYPRDSGEPLPMAEVSRLGDSVLDLLFEGYAKSIEPRSKPNLWTDYVDRIGDRLRKAQAVDQRFAPRALWVKGRKLRPWADYLVLLERQRDQLDRFAPPFSTVAHGDPNPGNLMLRLESGTTEIKFIDPKDWVQGDYLFDVAKLTHFLEVTGPVEKPLKQDSVHALYSDDGGLPAITYQYQPPEWTAPLVQACRARVAAFATANGDVEWEARYELAMAANLLGLPHGRLTHPTRPRPDSALVLYAEGLDWLDRFCSRLESATRSHSPFVVVGTPTEVEPEVLGRFRERVVQEVPGARRATDRRGFQLLQWPPTRPNPADKPQELSLEHEARLKPGSEPGLQQLLQNLHESGHQPLKDRVLPGESPFSGYRVRREDRPAGPQSVDQYYEVPHALASGRLIPRQYTLRRRLRTSEFMTWSAGAGPESSAEQPAAPLNLELPFVALGTSGMTVRLEFNWIDIDTLALTEALDDGQPLALRLNNPIYLASTLEGLSFEGAAPVIEHTTFREKFTFLDPAGEDAFALNVDHVTAQALATGRMGSYVEVDISSYRVIDAAELQRLTEFCAALSRLYGLVPNLCTKAWRDASVVGLLDV